MRRIFFWGSAIFVAIIGVSFLIFFLLPSYTDRVLPGVYLGEIPVGGLTRDAVRSLLHERTEQMNERGIAVTVYTLGKKNSFTIPSIVITEDTTRALIHIDEESALRTVLAYGKNGKFFHDRFAAFLYRFKQPSVAILQSVVLDREGVRETLLGRTQSRDQAAENARVR